jgi:hypothetical protein
MPACFVITGYGIKKDYINNRDFDPDKTFKHIVKPVFEEPVEGRIFLEYL